MQKKIYLDHLDKKKMVEIEIPTIKDQYFSLNYIIIQIISFNIQIKFITIELLNSKNYSLF